MGQAAGDTVTRVEQECTRLQRIPAGNERDPVVLLRLARKLRGIHTRLAQAVRAKHAVTGTTSRLRHAQIALDAMEDGLLQVLLHYQELTSCQLHAMVAEAFDHGVDALLFVQAEPGIPRAERCTS